MDRDGRFLVWHIQYAEIDDADDCDCTLGVVWDAAENWEQAERLVWRVMKFRERGKNEETSMQVVRRDAGGADSAPDSVQVLDDAATA